MSRCFVDLGLSLDGCIAGPNRRPGNPLGDGGVAIHDWMFRTATFTERIGWPGGERSDDDAWVRQVFERAGAYVMGMRMFEEGEVGWPEDAPFRAPVFVLTHAPRAPWPRKGGTTFHFVTGGLDGALAQARAAAGGKDVRISGGADTVRQALRAGVVDELTLHVAPLLIGEGLRLFDGLEAGALALEPLETSGSAHVSHVRYRVLRPGGPA